MKTLLALLPLAFCSCVSTTATYEGNRCFPVDVNPLEINVEYSDDFCTGSARTTTIMGVIKLGRSEHAYSKDSGGGLGLPSIASLLGGGSTESAAVHDALAKDGGDVLGFPLFRKKVTNYFLWSEEDVWVKGFSGKVSRGSKASASAGQ